MSRIVIQFDGIDDVLDALGEKSAKRAKRVIDDVMEEGIEAMAEGSYDMAPVDTGALKGSILASVTKLSRHHYMYGSIMPYAQRQEYEHKSKKYFFRRSVLKEAPEIRISIADVIRRHFNG